MRVVAFLFAILMSFPCQAQEDVDFVALASVLIRDGFFGRAERTLQKITPDDDVDEAKVQFLWGAIELQRKNHQKARDYFLKSVTEGLKDTEVYLYLADLEVKENNLSQAKEYIGRVGGEWKTKLPYFLLMAEILWQSQQKVEAWAALKDAENLNLNKNVLEKKRFQYFLADQLYFAAYSKVYDFFKAGGPVEDVVVMASQLRQKGQNELALRLLQMAQFRSPAMETLLLELAQIYLAQGQQYSAALILEEGARRNPTFVFEASELLRQTGKSYRARYLNMMTAAPDKQLKQKVALYLEDNEYQSLNYLLPQLEKYSLLQNDEIRYAVAYSLFQTGDFTRSEKMLSKIQAPDLFEKSIELRKEIQKCEKDSWGCYESI